MCIFFLVGGLDTSEQSQSILTLIVQTIVSAMLETSSWQSTKEPFCAFSVNTGAALSLGKGGIYSGSWKQRLVARSSTESELIRVYDVLPQVLWMKQFLEEQGWLDSATMAYQDNTSSILLERNGHNSSMKRTKHMNIQYFYVTEQIRKKAIHITHCPTEEMVGDFFTKPLQGSLFIKMRNYIMGNEEPGYQALPRSVLNNHGTTGIWK